MKTVSGLLVSLLLVGRMGLAAPKQHLVALGKWTTVKLMVGEDERTALDLKVRQLLVDGQSKEFTTGLPHEVTDRTFVIQRVFRLNDTLSQETVPIRWRWGARGMAVGQPRHWENAAGPAAGIRCLLFRGRLVSRLCGVLWRLRGWQKRVGHHRATRQAKAPAEKGIGRCRDARIRMRRSGLAARTVA